MVRDNRIKTYTFQQADVTATNSAPDYLLGSGGNFHTFTTHDINGLLKGIYVGPNSYLPTGSLFLQISGIGLEVWQLKSGTNTGMASESGGYIPLAIARDTQNRLLSGTVLGSTYDVRYTEYPMFGTYKLIGSAIRIGGSCLNITIVYQ